MQGRIHGRGKWMNFGLTIVIFIGEDNENNDAKIVAQD